MGTVSFLKTLSSGKCVLCPRSCGVERSKTYGLCKTKDSIEIVSYNLHFGEEPPISGTNGSGTIFFAGCNMGCVYCQNYPISQLKSTFKYISPYELANIMLGLQARGAHNINFVTPSHFVHLMCEAIEISKNKGLCIPIVYNTSSYDKKEVIFAIKDYIDIYLGDLKYSSDDLAYRLSSVKDYFTVAQGALRAMYETKEKGGLVIENGIAKKGLIVRHLVLPNHLENTKNVLSWILRYIPHAYISLMSQYFPAYNAYKFKDINRKLNYDEWTAILDMLNSSSNLNGYIQKLSV